MKNYLKLLTLCIITMGFIACSEDKENEEQDNTQTTVQPKESLSEFKGTLTVGDSYVQQDVVIKAKKGTDNKYTVYLDNVSFSSAMPVTISMELRDLNYSLNGNDTVFNYESIVPYYMNNPIERYTFHNFECTLNAESLKFSASSGETTSQGLSEIKYEGQRIK